MKKPYSFLVIFLLLFSLKLAAQAPVAFKGENLVIGNHVAILEDHTNQLSLQDVIKSDAFVASDVPIPNLKLSLSDFWLRFSIKNESNSEQIILALEYPMLSTCEFYSIADGKVQSLSYNNIFEKRTENRRLGLIFVFHYPTYIHGKKDSS